MIVFNGIVCACASGYVVLVVFCVVRSVEFVLEGRRGIPHSDAKFQALDLEVD